MNQNTLDNISIFGLMVSIALIVVTGSIGAFLSPKVAPWYFIVSTISGVIFALLCGLRMNEKVVIDAKPSAEKK